MQRSKENSWLGMWGSHMPMSGGQRVNSLVQGGGYKPSYLTYIQDHWDLQEALSKLQHNMHKQMHENMNIQEREIEKKQRIRKLEYEVETLHH